MDFVMYRVKNMEAFKDGNILGGRFLKPNEILTISESDYTRIMNSGGSLEVIEMMVPNPKKETEVTKSVRLQMLAEEAEREFAKENEVAQADAAIERAETPKPEQKKRGRPKKVNNVA